MLSKTNLTRRWLTLGLSVAAASALSLISACGGGGGGSGATPLPYVVLHSFAADSSDGAFPRAGLVANSAGDFFGVAGDGGVNSKGTAFKITRTGTFTLLHDFAGASDGAYPRAALVVDSIGDFYGTAIAGGANNWGTAFKMTNAGAVTLLNSFGAAASDGSSALAGLVPDGTGNFFGTTERGGTNNEGTAFKMTSAGVVTVLHSFGALGDGERPASALVHDGSGNFYGTTGNGGAFGMGTIFKISSAGAYTLVYSFTGLNDGSVPYAGLVADGSGNFYGTAKFAGANNQGTIFKVTSAGVFTLLHAFSVSTNDGAIPLGTLYSANNGNFYGTTYAGGANNKGTVYKITNTGVFTLLHSFGGLNDGFYPYAGLASDGAGNLYGTTTQGGANGNGTVFRTSAQ